MSEVRRESVSCCQSNSLFVLRDRVRGMCGQGVAHATTGTTMVIPLLENCGPRETNGDEKYG